MFIDRSIRQDFVYEITLTRLYRPDKKLSLQYVKTQPKVDMFIIVTTTV